MWLQAQALHNRGNIQSLLSLLRYLTILILIPMAMVFLLGACSVLKKDNPQISSADQTTSADVASTSNVLWENQNEFIRIEPREQGSSNAAPNDHPVTILPEQMSNLLATLRVKLPGKKSIIRGKTAIQVFGKKDIDGISEVFVTALEQAGPNEDIVMFKSGYYPTSAAALPERRASSARIFYKDGNLNVIFGELLRPYSTRKKTNKPLSFRQGSRGIPNQFRPQIDSRSPVVNIVEGRQDWVLLDQQALFAAQTSGSPQQQALQQRVEKLEQELQAKGQAPAVPSATQSADPNSTESRLVMLRDLRDKNLIPEDVYRKRVQMVLDEDL